MVEATTSAPVKEAVTESPTPIPLDHFCQDVSTSDKRVELLAAFHYTEKRAGRLVDTSAAYAARYADFANASPK
jgi:hypothetical protein